MISTHPQYTTVYEPPALRTIALVTHLSDVDNSHHRTLCGMWLHRPVTARQRDWRCQRQCQRCLAAARKGDAV